MTGPLYADTQSTVKSIVITIARLQLIHGDCEYWITLDGSNRLEAGFSGVRTADHAQNVTVQQLGNKMGTIATAVAVYARYPGLDPGHERLQVPVGAESFEDHSNPPSWRGDVCVCLVQWPLVWPSAQTRQQGMFAEYFEGFEARNLRNYFMAPESKYCDFSRPTGRYIGVSVDNYNKRSEREEMTTRHSRLQQR
jgi:hypothetical protein